METELLQNIDPGYDKKIVYDNTRDLKHGNCSECFVFKKEQAEEIKKRVEESKPNLIVEIYHKEFYWILRRRRN